MLIVFAAGTGAIYATSSSDVLLGTVEEDHYNKESERESISIGWGEDEVGDISASEVTEEKNSSEKIMEGSSTKIRIHPLTGETYTKEETEAILNN